MVRRPSHSIGRPAKDSLALGPGVYFLLFTIAMTIMLRRRPANPTASRVFIVGIVSMFTIVTFHNCKPASHTLLVSNSHGRLQGTNVYRMITAYAKSDDPVDFLRNWDNWDALAFPVISAIVTWIGDVLVVS